MNPSQNYGSCPCSCFGNNTIRLNYVYRNITEDVIQMGYINTYYINIVMCLNLDEYTEGFMCHRIYTTSSFDRNEFFYFC